MKKEVPQEILEQAHKHHYDTAEYYGTKNGATYYVMVNKTNDQPPMPIGYPLFARMKDGKVKIMDGREVFDIFRKG